LPDGEAGNHPRAADTPVNLKSHSFENAGYLFGGSDFFEAGFWVPVECAAPFGHFPIKILTHGCSPILIRRSGS
jgi:hypothetical protein